MICTCSLATRRGWPRVREAIGRTPYLIKIGHIGAEAAAAALIDAAGPYADGLSMTNSIATTVVGADGQLMFDGHKRGICGDAIRERPRSSKLA